MFRELKLKLTLINVSVLIIVIALLMAGIYALMVLSIKGQSEEQMSLIAEKAGSVKINTNLISAKYTPKDFYVKVDKKGRILETSPNVPIAPIQLQFLVNKALHSPSANALLTDQTHEEYRFLITPLASQQGVVIVFLGTALEKLYLGHLIIAFFITGIGGIALTLYCSLFMANRALIPIQNSWDSQKLFVADASHELRTPLTVIQTNLDIVLDSPTESVESQMLWLENIKLESKRMAKLVDDLLFLARTNSPQALLAMDYFSLDQALQEVITPFEPVAAIGGLSLSYSLEATELFGDRARIKQLAAIILDNAIKYTSAGGKITIHLKEANSRVLISVTDTGEGIAEEHIGKIFHRFYRVDTARSRESGGTGLGLSIADWIVKAHKGRIKVKSTPGQGTTIILDLPTKN